MMLKAYTATIVYQSKLAAVALDDAKPPAASIPYTIARSKRKLWAMTKVGTAQSLSSHYFSVPGSACSTLQVYTCVLQL